MRWQFPGLVAIMRMWQLRACVRVCGVCNGSRMRVVACDENATAIGPRGVAVTECLGRGKRVGSPKSEKRGCAYDDVC